ncbi:FCD domain-containing protein [Bradyrhizobium sp. LHD-71]|uniref:FCD domain-containing protein n=1 Tax=Bradyrhizobium sp. LHD-71 TaxID=3072141 RepID=UPI00280D7555|nr:FCD domain-containing protein [Bradyrhizobium sp. LHD-71]MDQ8732342.1 FCD domain-containing protein [Bradyrhizobium sp. LHD-71]
MTIVDKRQLTIWNPSVSIAVMTNEAAPAESALALLRNRSLASAAQEEIEKLILSGELRPGDKIGEAEMALRLGVSRGPIREAFRSLEEMGLVRFEKNRGVFVREVDLERADQNYVVRGALEALAVKILAEKITEDEVRELRAIVKRMEKAIARDEAAEYGALNLGLHRRIFEMTGNSRLLAIYSRITKELTLFRRRSLAPQPSLHEHRDIVEKIAAHDAVGASQAMLNHVESARLRILTTYSP